MIKGKAEINFGTGDIMMTTMLEDKKGIYILENQEPHEIGEGLPVNSDFTIEGKPIMITFTRTESIDVIIKDLQCIKDMMINGAGENHIYINSTSKDFWKER